MRQLVKPSIEIMEAMPTVILGFGGIVAAPLVESHLAGIFMVFILLPLVVLLAAYLWHRLPASVRGRIPEGWEAALLIPVVALTIWVALAASPMVEQVLFAGDMPYWLQSKMGIDFDQRNSLVVGMAMGFAVIPTIFSIAEDAIFAVPKRLTNGSLALGATTWQTLVRVVLLTASPGLFSAVMMGVGRAVGETMIVLMATGNTPVMDMSIFRGCDPFGQYRGGDAGIRGKQYPLPGAVPGCPGAVSVYLCLRYGRRTDSSAAARRVQQSLGGRHEQWSQRLVAERRALDLVERRSSVGQPGSGRGAAGSDRVQRSGTFLATPCVGGRITSHQAVKCSAWWVKLPTRSRSLLNVCVTRATCFQKPWRISRSLSAEDR